MTTHKRIRQRSFTLVEMLVVMAIIGILAAILLPAIRAAVTAAKNNRIAQEISSLHQAVEAYKQKFGDYPPDFNDPLIVRRHLRKAFPRHNDDRLAADAVTAICSASITPAEALVFWLSELCNDPRAPLTSRDPTVLAVPKDPHVLFSFDESRRIQTREITLPSASGPISLPLYVYVPKDGKDAPYVYFDSRSYALPTCLFYSNANLETVHPYKTAAGIAAADLHPVPPRTTPKVTRLPFANGTTFQIISAGLDGRYGNTLPGFYKPFPQGKRDVDKCTNLTDPAKADLVDYEMGPSFGDDDNITNFSDGKILRDHIE